MGANQKFRFSISTKVFLRSFPSFKLANTNPFKASSLKRSFKEGRQDERMVGKGKCEDLLHLPPQQRGDPFEGLPPSTRSSKGREGRERS
jgi:hypothetical protein